jgi:hypothetical protein
MPTPAAVCQKVHALSIVWSCGRAMQREAAVGWPPPLPTTGSLVHRSSGRGSKHNGSMQELIKIPSITHDSRGQIRCQVPLVNAKSVSKHGKEKSVTGSHDLHLEGRDLEPIWSTTLTPRNARTSEAPFVCKRVGLHACEQTSLSQ